MMPKLLTRDDFRNGCLKRDGYRCVVCGSTENLSVHHIMERRLFTAPEEFGGYFMENGATVCEEDHIRCEKTLISTDDIRQMVGITAKIIPSHLYDGDGDYDKWGNLILPNGNRLKGELFFDESVQKILADVLHLFVPYVKYPRTHHVPFSPGIHDDDRVVESMDDFIGKEVVVMNKLDGENSTAYHDYFHARSIDSRNHPSRNRAKAIWSTFAGDIPDGWRINMENLYAKHSIHYTDLESYVYGFAIWNEKNFCLDWDQTKEWFGLFGIPTPDELYRGVYDEKIVKGLWKDSMAEKNEGWVMRTVEGFTYAQFRRRVVKLVRRSHVQTNRHWMMGQEIIPNLLK